MSPIGPETHAARGNARASQEIRRQCVNSTSDKSDPTGRIIVIEHRSRADDLIQERERLQLIIVCFSRMLWQQKEG